MPPRGAETRVVGLGVVLRLGMPHKRSVAVTVTVIVPMVMVRMIMRMFVIASAYSGVFFELPEATSMKCPGVGSGGLKAGMR